MVVENSIMYKYCLQIDVSRVPHINTCYGLYTPLPDGNENSRPTQTFSNAILKAECSHAPVYIFNIKRPDMPHLFKTRCLL